MPEDYPPEDSTPGQIGYTHRNRQKKEDLPMGETLPNMFP